MFGVLQLVVMILIRGACIAAVKRDQIYVPRLMCSQDLCCLSVMCAADAGPGLCMCVCVCVYVRQASPKNSCVCLCLCARACVRACVCIWLYACERVYFFFLL